MTVPNPTSERAARKGRGLSIHAIAFSLVIALLAALNWYTGKDWVLWVVLGWGIGLGVHAGLVMWRTGMTQA